eukprot:SAG31_NODE_2369_length_5854_cov_3.778454_2_plen_414_part_00
MDPAQPENWLSEPVAEASAACQAKQKLQTRLHQRRGQRLLPPAAPHVPPIQLNLRSPLSEVLGLLLCSTCCPKSTKAALTASCRVLRDTPAAMLCEATSGFPLYNSLFNANLSSRSHLGQKIATELQARGYVVIDDFLEVDLSSALARAILVDMDGDASALSHRDEVSTRSTLPNSFSTKLEAKQTNSSTIVQHASAGDDCSAATSGGQDSALTGPSRLKLCWVTPTPYDWRDDLITWLTAEDLEGHENWCLQALGRRLAKLRTTIDEEVIPLIGPPEPYQLAAFAPGPKSRGYIRHIDEETPAVGQVGGLLSGGRRVTVTVYFTAGWEAGHGGELRLWPRRTAAEAGGGGAVRGAGSCDATGDLSVKVDVEPQPGRMVAFLSGAVWHQVRPWRLHRQDAKTKRRLALTAFLH